MSEDPKFGELKEVSMRKIWPHEAHKFTPWLKRNIGALGKALGLDLSSKQAEAQVGNFSLDLLAETGDGDIVAIENQFKGTDHKHLGQLLTYAAGCDAKILIWIVEEARDEHRAAVEWLNRKTVVDTHFYLFTEELEKRGFPFKLSRKFRDATPRRFFDCIDGSSQWWYRHEFEDGRAFIGISSNAKKKSIATKHIEALVKRKSTINKKLQLKWDGDWYNINPAIKYIAN